MYINDKWVDPRKVEEIMLLMRQSPETIMKILEGKKDDK